MVMHIWYGRATDRDGYRVYVVLEASTLDPEPVRRHLKEKGYRDIQLKCYERQPEAGEVGWE